ncbi:hypothetical protein HVH02_004808 [Salmonella enterica]|nr:hypothetical protein [Salmonella enterica]
MRNDGFVQNIHSHNPFDVIAKARAPEARAWLIQNKAEYMALQGSESRIRRAQDSSHHTRAIMKWVVVVCT